jgi:hypothetical protein
MVGQIISGNGIKGCIPYLQNKKSLTQIVSNKFLGDFEIDIHV